MLLTRTAPITSAGTIHFKLFEKKTGIALQLVGESQVNDLAALSDDLNANLEIVHSLVKLSGGSLELSFGGNAFQASLACQSAHRCPF